MRIVEVKTKEEQKRYLSFRKEIYGKGSPFVDNDIFLLKELFSGKTSFTKNKEVMVVYVEESGRILCQGILVYANALRDYIQLSFFVSRPNVKEAVQRLVDKAAELGKCFGCNRLVVGLNGHVNYGLGFLASNYGEKNSFAASYNPEYYNTYFQQMDFEEVFLNTYIIASISNQLERYDAFLRKTEKSYSVRYFNRKEFDKYAKIYTDLNNHCFANHRYYYPRDYEEDAEMLKELFLFMKEDSLIFLFEEEKPVAFIMWYPDFNELARPGEAFGTKHFLMNLFGRRKIKTAKVMEFGIVNGYQKAGLPLVLIHQVFMVLKNYGATKAETSWVLEENVDSRSFCEAICDGKYKRYVVYEKEI